MRVVFEPATFKSGAEQGNALSVSTEWLSLPRDSPKLNLSSTSEHVVVPSSSVHAGGFVSSLVAKLSWCDRENKSGVIVDLLFGGKTCPSMAGTLLTDVAQGKSNLRDESLICFHFSVL